MSSDLFEQKWKYIEIKEKMLKIAFGPKATIMESSQIPVRIKHKIAELPKKVLPQGYDPYKLCKKIELLNYFRS